MPTRLAAPVLMVDANKMHKIDTRNAENLFGMWQGENPMDVVVPFMTNVAVSSLFQVCGVDGRGSTVGEPQLEDMEQRDVLLRISTTAHHHADD